MRLEFLKARYVYVNYGGYLLICFQRLNVTKLLTDERPCEVF